MKIIDQPYQCQLSNPLLTDWFLDCHLQIFRIQRPFKTWIEQNVVCVRNIILVANMGFEMGWFIPQLIETLVNSVVQDFNLDPRSLIWLEHYPVGDSQYIQSRDALGFSLVTFEWEVNQPKRPRWVDLSYQDLTNLMEPDDLKMVLGKDWPLMGNSVNSSLKCQQSQRLR